MNTPSYRNLGISAHIDAGRTTITERILEIKSQIIKTQKDTEKVTQTGPTVGERITNQLILNLLK